MTWVSTIVYELVLNNVNEAKNFPFTLVPQTLTTKFVFGSTNINGQFYELGPISNTGNLYIRG